MADEMQEQPIDGVEPVGAVIEPSPEVTPSAPEVTPLTEVVEPETLPPVTTEAPAETVPEVPVPTISAPKKSHKTIYALLIVVVLLVLVGVGILATKSSHTTVSKATTASSKASTVAKVPTNSTSQFVDSYLPVPEPVLPKPQFFTNYATYLDSDCTTSNATTQGDCLTNDQLDYEKIGTTKAGQSIIVMDNGLGGEEHQEYVALQTGSSSYSVLAQTQYQFRTTGVPGTDIGPPSAADVAKAKSDFQAALAPGTTLDTTTMLTDLDFNPTFKLSNTNFTLPSSSSGLYDGYAINGITTIRGSFYKPIAPAAATKVGMDGPKTIYEVKAVDGDYYSVNEIYSTINQDYAAAYQISDDIANNSEDNNTAKPAIKYSDGTVNKDDYTYSGGGCGSANGFIVAKNLTSSDLTSVGTSPTGRTVYQLAETSPLFKELYNEDYGSGTNLSDATLQNLSADQFQAKHAVLVAKDGLGEYVVYKDVNFFSGGGCGKPVVYLYPQSTEKVSVQVGATIKKSVPQYGVNGWSNVVANPDGQLTYQGNRYSNLFWEGIGNGAYPAVESGVEVARADAVPTIKRQLSDQGLKTSEINDFVAYWGTRMPDTKYVRLTWFDTAQMNELAPLSVTPKPDTMLRVFLDFQGLNRKISLPAQHFSAPARTGFTVVEWGGLNRTVTD